MRLAFFYTRSELVGSWLMQNNKHMTEQGEELQKLQESGMCEHGNFSSSCKTCSSGGESAEGLEKSPQDGLIPKKDDKGSR